MTSGSTSPPTRTTCGRSGFGRRWDLANSSRTSSIPPAPASANRSRVFSILSNTASARRPKHRYSSMTPPKSSTAPAAPAGRPYCSPPLRMSPPIPGLPRGSSHSASWRFCDAPRLDRRLPMAPSTAPRQAPICGLTIFWPALGSRKAAAMTDINAFIDEKVKNNDVFLFMKESPDFPQCGFSGQVVQILGYLGVTYDSANVLDSAELRDGIKAYTNWPTIPQLYVKGEFVGGADIVREMFQAGELQAHMEAAGIPVKQTA